MINNFGGKKDFLHYDEKGNLLNGLFKEENGNEKYYENGKLTEKRVFDSSYFVVTVGEFDENEEIVSGKIDYYDRYNENEEEGVDPILIKTIEINPSFKKEEAFAETKENVDKILKNENEFENKISDEDKKIIEKLDYFQKSRILNQIHMEITEIIRTKQKTGNRKELTFLYNTFKTAEETFFEYYSKGTEALKNAGKERDFLEEFREKQKVENKETKKEKIEKIKVGDVEYKVIYDENGEVLKFESLEETDFGFIEIIPEYDKNSNLRFRLNLLIGGEMTLLKYFYNFDEIGIGVSSKKTIEINKIKQEIKDFSQEIDKKANKLFLEIYKEISENEDELFEKFSPEFFKQKIYSFDFSKKETTINLIKKKVSDDINYLKNSFEKILKNFDLDSFKRFEKDLDGFKKMLKKYDLEKTLKLFEDGNYFGEDFISKKLEEIEKFKN